jgi:hypothetical protein
VQRLHVIAVKGSLLANDVALRLLQKGQLVPLQSQTWWYRCFTACGQLKNKRSVSKDPEIEASVQILGQDSQASLDYTWPFVASLARDSATLAENHVRANFHAEVRKALSREVVLWEITNQSLTSELRFRTIEAGLSQALCEPKYRRDWPVNVPELLKAHLESVIADWRSRFSLISHCPKPEFLKTRWIPIAHQWMWELQVQRSKILASLTEEQRLLFRGLGRACRCLPLYSFGVKHICIDPTGLETLLAEQRQKPSKPLDFFSYFPGARELRLGRAKLYPLVRTDGVSASICVSKSEREATVKQGPGTVKVDMHQNTPPRLVQPHERLVAVDPGRRTMITATVYKEGKFEGVVKVSTKEMVSRAKIKKHRQSSLRHLSRFPSFAAYQQLPCNRALEKWSDYLSALLPLLEELFHAYSSKKLRRERLSGYIARDKALDSICQKLAPKSQTTLVAFGAASACSSGFGYAPAPQGRLRHRLKFQAGARVSLIDEYYTSQRCHRCHGRLDKVYLPLPEPPGARKLCFGVLKCNACRSPGGGALYHNRDINACHNIAFIFRELARIGERPAAFSSEKMPSRGTSVS